MSSAPLLHTREPFSFLANAPFEVAWPLFGADRERVWAPGWEPVFLWPEKAFDQEGMVFRIRSGEKNAVWVNTAFDPAAGRIQYVYVIPEEVLTVITLNVMPNGPKTMIDVVYERTALNDAANEIVRNMAARDSLAGEEWSRQINSYIEARLDKPRDQPSSGNNRN